MASNFFFIENIWSDVVNVVPPPPRRCRCYCCCTCRIVSSIALAFQFIIYIAYSVCVCVCRCCLHLTPIQLIKRLKIENNPIVIKISCADRKNNNIISKENCIQKQMHTAQRHHHIHTAIMCVLTAERSAHNFKMHNDAAVCIFCCLRQIFCSK